MKKNLASFLLAFCLIVSSLMLRGNALAAQPIENPVEGFTKAIEGTEAGSQFKPKLEKFVGRPHELSSVEPGAEIITTAIFNVIDFLKYVLGTIAVLYITIGGVRLILSHGNVEEVSKKQKQNFTYILIGLALTILADVLVQQVFFGEYGECLASETNAQACAEEGSAQVRGVYNFMEVFIASIAVLVIVMSAFRLVTSAGEEEVISRQKKRIMYSIVGLVVVGLSEFVVKDVIFPDAGSRMIDVAQGQRLFTMITNFVSAFVGTLSFVFLVYGGWMYIASFGNPDQTGKAKKIIIGALVGIGVAFAAFGAVRTIFSIDTRGDPVTPPGIEDTSGMIQNPTDRQKIQKMV